MQECCMYGSLRGRSDNWRPYRDRSTARVFLWETTFTLHPRRKSGSRKRRSPPSASDGVITRAVDGRSPHA